MCCSCFFVKTTAFAVTAVPASPVVIVHAVVTFNAAVEDVAVVIVHAVVIFSAMTLLHLLLLSVCAFPAIAGAVIILALALNFVIKFCTFNLHPLLLIVFPNLINHFD